MAVSAPAVTIERIDHGVVPSSDLGRAYRFWGSFMGRLDHFANLNLRGLNREVPEMFFYTVANHGGFGVALQDYPVPSAPARDLEGVVWGFEVAAEDLDGVRRAAEARQIRVVGSETYPASSPVVESLFLLDPDGNTIELCRRRDPWPAAPQEGPVVPLRRISHVRAEVTDLDLGARWYGDTFGLIQDDEVPGPDQVTLTVPRTQQYIILRKVDQVAERSTRWVKGPHMDFRISVEHYPTILDRFDRREFYWGQDPTAIPWHEPDPQTVYGYDPFGNRIQIGAARPH
jgi:catechol 2,3-dioxygenase-like lactoylglutathione lyase family enzyme